MKAQEINKYVGERLLQLRHSRGLTQEALGKLMGVTFQQIQKYENGKNGMSAHKLYLCARQMDVTPLYFFEELWKTE